MRPARVEPPRDRQWPLRGGLLLGVAVLGVPAVLESWTALVVMVVLIAIGLLLQARAGRRHP